MRRILLYALTSPAGVGAWLVVVLAWVFAGRRLAIRRGALVAELSESRWLTRAINAGFRRLMMQTTDPKVRWGGTALGPFAGIFGDGLIDDDQMLDHELDGHGEQYQALAIACLGIAVVARLAGARLSFVVSEACAGPLFCILTGMPTAWLREEPNAYLGSVFEEGARAKEIGAAANPDNEITRPGVPGEFP